MRKLWIPLVLGLSLGIAPAASAISVLSLLWRDSGTPTTVAPAPSSLITADIVLTADSSGVTGVFTSFAFDPSELEAVGAVELPVVDLVFGSFSPVSLGVVIDNVNGLITSFDQATLGTGLIDGTRTLGSLRFHVVGATGAPDDIDVVPALVVPGVDAIFATDGSMVPALLEGAAATEAPEPPTTTLVALAVAVLAYRSRRS